MQNFEISAKIRELREKIELLREEEEILNLKVQNKTNEVESIRDRRDQLNAQVKELSQKPKEIMEGRKNIWETIAGTNEEKRTLIREMQPFLHKIGRLRRIRDSYNFASRGTMEKLEENLRETKRELLTSDLSLKNELFMYNFLFELRDRMLLKIKADEIHRSIVEIKERDLGRYNQILSEIEGKIGSMKNLSHEGLLNAKEMWTRRDEIREQAQKEHRSYLEGLDKIKVLKRQWWEKKKEIHGLYRQIDDWRDEFKKSPTERRQADMSRRQKDALAKFKKGEKLTLDELSLVVESGQMNK